MAASLNGQTQSEPQALQLQADLTIGSGSSVVVTLPGISSRVALADDTVAMLRVITERELLVTGLKLAQTTLHVWLEDGRRLLYPVNIRQNLTLIQDALRDIDASITVEDSSDGNTLVLKGEVEMAADASEAERRVKKFFGSATAAGAGVTIVNLIKYETGGLSFERDLAQALKEIDPRIRLRRIRVERGAYDQRNPQEAARAIAADRQSFLDSFVLSGRVANLRKLSQALELADRYLGGGGGAVYAPQHIPIQGRQSQAGSDYSAGQNFNFGSVGGSGAGGNGQGGTDASVPGQSGGRAGGGAGFGGYNPPAGLANFVSRGLNLTTAGGRVVSFLEVDALDQILVSIRVLEIDRRRAHSLGVNYVVNSSDFAIGNFTAPTGRFGVAPVSDAATKLGSGLLNNQATGSGANLMGAYVGDSTGINAAIDFLEQQGIGRSVAEPNVLTLTGEQSTIEVGGQVPIPTTAATSSAAFQGYFFQNFGVRLDIRPTLDENGIVTLEASPTIIEPDDGLNVEGVPGFSVQSVSTTARVRGDQSLVIGGLISYDDNETERKVPVLGDVPVLKSLFKWKRKTRDEFELLFVITPHIKEDLGIDGDRHEIELPGQDSQEEIPFGKKINVDELTLDGIPVSWLVAEDELSSNAVEIVPSGTARQPVYLNNGSSEEVLPAVDIGKPEP